jgi:hypothetical protein
MIRTVLVSLVIVITFLNSDSLVMGGGDLYDLRLPVHDVVMTISPERLPVNDDIDVVVPNGKEMIYISNTDNNPFLTATLTILGGVIVYVLGQILLKFFIEPIHEQRKIIGEVADALIYYDNIYSNPGIMSNQSDSGSERFRELATLLQSKTQFISFYPLFERLKVVIASTEIYDASRNLIGLSNSMGRLNSGDRNSGRAVSIRLALNIYSPED